MVNGDRAEILLRARADTEDLLPSHRDEQVADAITWLIANDLLSPEKHTRAIAMAAEAPVAAHVRPAHAAAVPPWRLGCELDLLAEDQHAADHHEIARTIHPQPGCVDCRDFFPLGHLAGVFRFALK